MGQMQSTSGWWRRIDVLVFLLGLVLLLWQLGTQSNSAFKSLFPQNIFSVQLYAQFEPDDSEVDVYTYLPQDGPYQQILAETLSSDSMSSRISEDESGRQVHWSGNQDSRTAQYALQVKTQGVKFHLADNLVVPDAHDESLAAYLEASENIQVNHLEIQALWNDIAPKSNDVRSILQAIYQYTWKNIETVPFKGTTDALTTYRLGTASCNGKSRLFVALARLNGIPARLVGGLILNNGSKKTSHQWVEAYVENQWIPFGPTNGYFAERPAHYLRLYQGDEVLFRHTSNIAFDYEFTIQNRWMASTFLPGSDSNAFEGSDEGTANEQENDDEESGRNESSATEWNLAKVLSALHISQTTAAILLLFPLCTLLITFLRNVVGVKTFGVFMPMLVAAACLYSGLVKGLMGFLIIVAVATLFHGILEKLRILKTARLAAVITIVTICFLAALGLVDEKMRFEFGMLSLFPIVIISFISERVYQVISVQDWKDFWLTFAGTAITLLLCYSYMDSVVLQSAFSYYPSLFLFVLAAQLYIGQWSGIRLSEMLRFRNVLKNNPGEVVGINRRNRELVYKVNNKSLLSLAADKLATKDALIQHEIPVAENLLICRRYGDIEQFDHILEQHTSFVIKPNQGSQGNGIIVIREVLKEFHGITCISAGGKKWKPSELKRHIQEILAGTYSQTGLPDVAYIEPKLEQATLLTQIAPGGLSDIRIIVANGTPVSAMLRMPTEQSSGKANLHQGAIGVAIDLRSGQTLRAQHKSKVITKHPDTGASLIGVQIPDWHFIYEMACRCFQAIPLGYLGVDICIDEEMGPLVLEVNGRPGLEIQNVHAKGFREDMQKAFFTAEKTQHENPVVKHANQGVA